MQAVLHRNKKCYHLNCHWEAGSPSKKRKEVSSLSWVIFHILLILFCRKQTPGSLRILPRPHQISSRHTPHNLVSYLLKYFYLSGMHHWTLIMPGWKTEYGFAYVCSTTVKITFAVLLTFVSSLNHYCQLDLGRLSRREHNPLTGVSGWKGKPLLVWWNCPSTLTLQTLDARGPDPHIENEMITRDHFRPG